MKYEDMSDFEINKKIVEIKGLPIVGNINELFVEVESEVWNAVDYCNNPSDAWPIMLDNKIAIYPTEGPDFMPWQAGAKSIMATDENPLRAAMIVFLKMQESSNEQ